MRIGIDVTSLCRQITGIEYYALNLTKNILKRDSENDYVLFFRKNIHPELEQFKPRAKFLMSHGNQIFCEQFWLPYMAQKDKVDVMHFPAFPPGVFTKRNFIFTIHDATVWKYKDTLSWKGKYYMRPLTHLGARRAKKILTVSENSKKDISEYAKIPLTKIVNTYESINERFRGKTDVTFLQNIKKKHNLPEKYILSVCSIEPRKNLSRLLEAYVLLRKNMKDMTHKLVLVGRKAWGNASFYTLINKLNLKNDIIVTDYLSDEELLAFYHLADIFVFPSIYEGFGLPVLEAMACNTAVITANTSSLPEVVGDAGLMVNPFDVNEIYAAMRLLLQDQKLKKRLEKLGIDRINIFSWEGVVEKVLKAYRSFNNH